MKKIFYVAAVALATTVVSCDNSDALFNKSNVVVAGEDTIMVDSLAYQFGAANSDLKYIAQAQFRLDSAYIDAFIEGMKEGVLEGEVDSAELARNAGVEFGRMVKATAEQLETYISEVDSNVTVNPVLMLKGIMDGYEEKVDATVAGKNVNMYMAAIQSATLLKQYAPNKESGEKFLAENAKNDSVVTTASGLQYKVLVEGKGALPTDTTVVKVKYEGRLLDGTVFDTNLESEDAFEVDMKYPSVIPGWVEVLKLMPVGSKWEVYIPYSLAYGEQGSYGIEPFSTLIFTIEVLE